LVSIVLSLVLPLVKINIWQPHTVASNQAIQLLQVVSSGDRYMEEVVIGGHINHFSYDQLLSAGYLFVSVILFCLFIHVLYKIRRLIYTYRGQIIEQFFFINTDAKGTPFSFLNYIFWNDEIDIETFTGRQILRHEVAHIQERHSYDKIFINLLLIVCWFNPFFWLIRKELNMIHEFVADKKAIADSDSEAFAAMILQAAYPQHRFELANNFFYSPIKRRLLMLSKNKNPKVNYFSRLMVLPVAVIVFAAFTLKTTTPKLIYPNGVNAPKINVVIDAGHGGKDKGGMSADGNVFEKDIALSLIKKIKELNTDPNINIILTREDDSYQSPPEKVAFTKQQNADLFISMHVDVTPQNMLARSGMSIWVAKNNSNNSGASKLFASALISEFNNNYGIDVSPQPQQREVGIWVLQGNTCPAVLIEAGNMSNKKDLQYLLSKEGQQKTAENILKAIQRFNTAAGTENAPAVKITLSASDTVPKKLMQEVDTSKRLIIVDGKITGFGNDGLNKANTLMLHSFQAKYLKPKEAITKYGNDGRNGAVEIVTVKNKETAASEQVNTVNVVPVPEESSIRIAESPEKEQPNMIFQKVEIEPSFTGGQAGWRTYLEKNLNPALPVDEGFKPGKYEVKIKFIVGIDGSVQKIEALNFKNSKTAAHCIDIIKKGPKWIPAMQNGHVVNAYKIQPITFVITNEDSK
ncbi:MAG: N-acetylmuramoyl-L-alanine amidase, partial [Ferruginibacter sp.]